MAQPTTVSRAVAAVAAGAVLVALAACTGSTAPDGRPDAVIQMERNPAFPRFSTDPDVPVIPNLVYGRADDGSRLLLDVCLPSDDTTGTSPAAEQTQAPATDAPGTEGAEGGVATPDPATPDPADPKGAGSPSAPDRADAAPGSRSGARAAVLMVHGGSWERGDKATIAYRAVCQWLARSSGMVVFNADYRLAPRFPYPAAIADLRTAVRWIREPTQQRRFDVDPDRVGAFGGSAGGNLVALLGTEGRGRLDAGSRVAAVVELSGPIDLRGEDIAPVLRTAQLSYLGCASFDQCRTAAPASASTWIDRSDPPFLVAQSTDEVIPLSQSAGFVEKLRTAGVATTFVQTVGTNHSIAQLPGNPRLRARIVQFLRTNLAAG
ncbi:MAG: alpha/beta hydrolase [Micrococcales bacterium]|nr:alpha/beta hydrolase [Micrococcales bacterium]